MRKKMFAILMVGISVVFAVIGLHIYNKRSLLPPDGLYFNMTNGYLAFTRDEKLVIPLFVTSVHKRNVNPLENSTSFALITESGNEVEILLEKDEIQKLYDSKNKYTQTVINVSIKEASTYLGEREVFTAIKYVDNNKVIIRNIGKIIVDFLDQSNDEKIVINNNMLFRNSAMEKLIFEIDYEIKNYYDEDLYITDVYFEIEGIKADLDTITYDDINDLKKQVKIDVIESESANNQFLSYILKPKILWKVGENTGINTVNNAAIYVSSSNEENLIKYLKEYNKGQNDKGN
ncbi:hypothetical protein [Anaerobranca gottschalkii]|uniref:Uncharacterized protein n=1 Tax=Anaerobranca gottschalkii DSM 13577 TaxID=1120990 RepID=A0A1I0CS23_9FIRM|nr:hypothetical protein [Anaerobranca gottschalkii]SET22061.1 hypothetical protein SAMN03080614_10882 [Anaerobranca gottschalkii DSM 13577]